MAIEDFDINKKYGLIDINGNMYLYNDLRFRRDSVPEGAFVYSIRDTDDFMDLASIEYKVWVNHSMDIIAIEELQGTENGIEIEEWETIGKQMTFHEFKAFMEEREKAIE
ncbi:LPD28 domain-containing protein [Listeria seeligeri]|uniref:LPD28 domain-containing protein n=1 Tax=Listeria seeligeri TaxID=1640 RepID=UPI0022EBC1A2|nr:LPD28 domain-containing protein [Listeria seeligeri]